ncbi:MAG: hypothetical protein A2X46_03255 [Lentisphaerae bacterium GWF2_57_35]|nr:MAG: hypothetical protein A2X46_03255 [Lentisphaerae bacterium GWF2_57_35]
MSDPLAHNPTNKKLSAFYDVLLCTDDQVLWNEFAQFFKTQHPNLRVGYVPSPDKLKPVLSRLAPEGLLLHDLRAEPATSSDEQPAMWGRIKEHAVVIGLWSSEELPEPFEKGPWIRLDAVLSASQKAAENWSRIQNISAALKQPLMSLRIEDVAVSNILQLLTMSERGSNVAIHGRKNAQSPWVDGRLFFQNGILHFAVTGGQAGDAAVIDLLGLKDGTIEVYSCCWLPGRRNIQCMTDKLLLDYAVGCDESSSQEPTFAQPAKAAATEPAESLSQGFEKEDLAAALAAGTWGSSSHRESPDRFQGASSFQMFRAQWSVLPSSLIEQLEQSGEGQLPLDWMTPNELSSYLDLNPGQRVVALRGSLEFLICMMAPWGERFQIDRFAAGARPAIRVENDADGSIWFVGDLDDQPADILSDYPCAVWTEPQKSDLTLRREAALGHPAVILMTSDLKLYSISLNWGLAYEGRVTVAHDCIIAMADSWSHVRRGLAHVLKVLKGLAVRCK